MLLPVLNLQMHRLVLFMVRPRAAHRGQDIKRNCAVGFRVLDFRALVSGFGGAVISAGVFESPRSFTAEEVSFETGIHDPAIETQRRMEGRAHIADLLQFFPDGALAQRVLVVVQEHSTLIRVRRECGVRGLCGEYATAHGGMGAFDLGNVQEARGIAYERPTGKRTFRDRLKASLVQSSGAVGDAFPALDDGFVQRMVF